MLLDKIHLDLQEALKAKNGDLVSTLRYLLAEIKNRQIALRSASGRTQGETKMLGDDDVLAAIKLQVKQHRESIELYTKGNRADLAAKERQEMDYLSKYLPQLMDSKDLEKIVGEVISQVKPTGSQDFGRVMGEVMSRVKGKADGQQVSLIVKKLL
jgi:uncharacterized protein YqeY